MSRVSGERCRSQASTTAIAVTPGRAAADPGPPGGSGEKTPGGKWGKRPAGGCGLNQHSQRSRETVPSIPGFAAC
jgi:hypothetical protein